MHLKKITTHLLVWLIYMIYEILIVYIGGMPIKPLNILVTFAINAGIFYAAWLSFITIRAQVNSSLLSIFLYLLACVVIVVVSVTLKVFTEMWLNSQPMEAVTTKTRLSTLTMRSIYFSLIGIGYSFVHLAAVRQKEIYQHELDKATMFQEQQKLQKNALQSELDLIKSQINPHFLFNTLGFLYSQTYNELPKVGQSILMLSDIMRHALSGTKNGFSTLESELSYINDYINIHKERNDNMFFNYTPNHYPDSIEIVSMVLITLVENMFKHGLLNRADKEAVLKIELVGKRLHYYSFNHKNANRKMESNHIGLAYIKQRLLDEYGTDFTLEVKSEEFTYECRLILPVKL